MINTNYAKIGKAERLNRNPEGKPTKKKSPEQVRAE